MTDKRYVAIVLVGILIFSLCCFSLIAKETHKVTPLDIILLIDCSPSTKFTDPENIRINAARLLIDYLEATSELLGINYRAGVINFGGELGETIPLSSLIDNRISQSLRAEIIPYTDFRVPLKFALNEFRAKSFGTGNRQALILFTDGSPQLTDKLLSFEEKKYYFSGKSLKSDKGDFKSLKLNQQILKLINSGVQIYVVATGDASKDALLWQTLIPSQNYHSINDIKDLVLIYYTFGVKLSELTTFFTKTLESNQKDQILIQPYLEQIIFSFLKNHKDVQVTLLTPQRQRIQPQLGGRNKFYDIYIIKNPEWERPWLLNVRGGSVKLNMERILPNLTIKLTPDIKYANESITVSIWLNQGKKVIDDSELNFNVNIYNSLKEKQGEYALDNMGGGLHQTQIRDLNSPGKYTLRIQASLGKKPLETNPHSTEFTIYAMKSQKSINSLSAKPMLIWLIVITPLFIIIFYLFQRIRKIKTKNKHHPLKNHTRAYNEIEVLKNDGLKFYEDNNMEKSVEKIQSAIESLNEYAHLSNATASKELSSLLEIMIEKPLKGALKKQRDIIYRQAAPNAPEWKLVGISSVLFERWISNPQYSIEEFYGIANQAKGMAVIKEMSKIKINSEWENERKQRAERILELTKDYYLFNVKLGEEE